MSNSTANRTTAPSTLLGGWHPALLRLMGVVLALSAGGLPANGDDDRSGTFANPILETANDPWVIRWQGDYLYCYSWDGGIWVRRSSRLQDLARGKPVCVWPYPATGPHSQAVWAPELHRVRGQWYIYFAASDGDNAHHRMFVLEGASQNPQEPFRFKSQLKPQPDRWAIDGTVLQMPSDKLYFVWSGWEAAENTAQNLYIAAMTNPWTIHAARACISRPDCAWERIGGLPTNEGPQVLWHGDRLFIIYSASGSWTDSYCLGQLAWNGGDVLRPESWVKHPRPVFSANEHAYGPGHASFVKSPSGKEDWIVYHAAKRKGSGWARNGRIQKFSFGADGSPNFGQPVAPGAALPVPK